jgi:phosphopantothenoylcysteine synthetase/decarboxylase
MSILSGKNILLGVTGGIAAYKSTYLDEFTTLPGRVG